MNKKLFVLLVILMSLSLLGIIFVQVYWIRTSINDKEEQFSRTVTDILGKVADRVEMMEMKEYSDRLASMVDSIGEPKSTQYRNFLFVDRDLNSDEILFYSHGILEEDYNVSSTFFDNTTGEDTTTLKNYTSKRTKAVFKEEYGLDGKSFNRLTPIQRMEKIGGLTSIERAAWEDVFMEYAKTRPIHKRVSKPELELLLSQELNNRNINIDYEYGVYSQGYPTKIRSRKFKFSGAKIYKAPIFEDSEGYTNFSLLLTFPAMKKFIFSSIMKMALLSLVFTLVIMIAYTSAIYQLIKQKRISEIKSDFINNMTHEFKTPIATINLAVEAIRNPKSIEDKEKVLRYLGMIRDENKRMHAQVENVLRISKLEKNQLDINKDRVDMHDIIGDAIAHVELIVQDRGGYVNAHLDAERSDVLANDMHMTNVIVNILDNAVKYSPETPKIDVFTEVVKNNIIIKVQDQGAGMSKAVLKKVFEKFYREHTGDIHNVKGHGLGLAYVKRIIEDHQGEVYAESEKGKGSTFFIKLPLI
ncbi:two-component system, OmpR family, phosphate regulon sensor histidine kinase PhoR [Flagellimonas taeanensis]|uniref:histidine kinase n=1 Tax=Flagellimonas taeanensis TaxID=1005926 RepID=A0A1M7BXB1_9FLAO|nr:HAMP domain-containing sensor histidine kinase [Allomuricauda taeanensis]SFC50639.1 two-component system, OmpR family, phosphate regulon sensor histidine kinase PhoR [Allomuricauda taeanensis]SHL59652.1 two-component system, OmpR family, phosphate regulon sensor histidine kinase PhoR [Allomuricauda taeanensis]